MSNLLNPFAVYDYLIKHLYTEYLLVFIIKFVLNLPIYSFHIISLLGMRYKIIYKPLFNDKLLKKDIIFCFFNILILDYFRSLFVILGYYFQLGGIKRRCYSIVVNKIPN